MDTPNLEFYFRAMSAEEYRMWEREDDLGEGIIPGTEWISSETSRGYGLRFLKEEWVDPAVRRELGDLYSIIVGVKAKDEDGFSETPMIIPVRYTNSKPIEFGRLRIIYDPRATILDKPLDIDLEDPTRLLREF